MAESRAVVGPSFLMVAGEVLCSHVNGCVAIAVLLQSSITIARGKNGLDFETSVIDMNGDMWHRVCAMYYIPICTWRCMDLRTGMCTYLCTDMGAGTRRLAYKTCV